MKPWDIVTWSFPDADAHPAVILGTEERARTKPKVNVLLCCDRAVASQTGQEQSFSIFDSHPMTETRLKDIRQRAAALTVAARSPLAPDTVSVWKKLDGIWWGQNPEAGVFHESQFLHPSIGFTITFPSGWKHRNTPQFVMAASPGQEALLMLGMAAGELDPQAAGEKLVQQMESRAGLRPASARKTSLGEFPAYVVTYQDRSGRAVAYLHFAWVAMGSKTYRLIGLAPENDEDVLRTAALTLRPLTDEERSTITGKRLRIFKAQPGEQLKALGNRSGNVWSSAYTALVNGLDADQSLAEGQWVKIAQTEPVRAKY
jgi:predicted Zn-dependent protease